MVYGPSTSCEDITDILTFLFLGLSPLWHHVSYWQECARICGLWNKVFVLIRKVMETPVPQILCTALLKEQVNNIPQSKQKFPGSISTLQASLIIPHQGSGRYGSHVLATSIYNSRDASLPTQECHFLNDFARSFSGVSPLPALSFLLSFFLGHTFVISSQEISSFSLSPLCLFCSYSSIFFVFLIFWARPHFTLHMSTRL